MSWVATAILGSGVLSAATTAWGASKASDAQQQAAQQAQANQMAMFQQSKAALNPYMNLGNYSGGLLQSELPSLIKPINMDQATLEKTPGYQFNLTQGLKATQNSAAARGLGSSGAALKGAATFATGLADNTYQNQFNNAMQNKQFEYNSLLGPTQVGENAAGALAGAANNEANGVSSALGYGGNAQAQGYNAFGTAANSLGNSVTLAGLYGKKNGLFGSTG